VLVTHGIQYLPDTDFVIVLDEGQITESGTYAQLIAANGPFSKFLAEHMNEPKKQAPETTSPETAPLPPIDTYDQPFNEMSNGHGEF